MRRGLRRPRRGTSTSATSRTRCTCGASPARPVGAWCCGSRTTIGSARGPSSTPRCSRILAGWGSSPTPAPFASRTTGRCTRRPLRGCGMAGWSTPATAPARRSPRGRGRTGGRGRVAAVRAAAASATLAEAPRNRPARRPRIRRGDVARPAAWTTARRRPTAKATCSCATATATGPIRSASSSTTCARASTSSSGARTCSTRRRARSGSAGSWDATARLPSITTR